MTHVTSPPPPASSPPLFFSLTPSAKGVCLTGAPQLGPRMQLYLLKWCLYVWTWVTPSWSTTARFRGAQRDPWPPTPPYVPMCAGPIWAWSYHVLPAAVLSSTLMSSDDMASGYISLGLHTQPKECLCSHAHKKESISQNTCVRKRKRNHIVKPSYLVKWNHIINLLT